MDTDLVEVMDIVSMLPVKKRPQAKKNIVKPLLNRATKIQAKIKAIIHEATTP